MSNKSDLVSFDELEGNSSTQKQGIISKLLERVKNTITFDNFTPSNASNYPPKNEAIADKAPNKQLEVKRPNSRNSNNSSEAIRNLRRAVEESNPKPSEVKPFNLNSVISKFIYASESNSESQNLQIDVNKELNINQLNNWENRQRGRKGSFNTTNSQSSGAENESPISDQQNNFAFDKEVFYKNKEGKNSSSSLFNTRPTEAVTGILKRLQGQDGGINKAYWMKDEHCHECYNCGKPFTQLFRRKHHCRICGQIFCSDCASNMISGESMGHPGLIRVCDYCFTLRNSVNNYENTTKTYESDSCAYAVNQSINKSNGQGSNVLTKERVLEELNHSKSPGSILSELPSKSEGLKMLLTAGTRVANNFDYKIDQAILIPPESSVVKKISKIENTIESNLPDDSSYETINDYTEKESGIQLKKGHNIDQWTNKNDNYSMITGFKDSIAYTNNTNEIIGEGNKFKSHSFPRKSLMNNNLTSPNARKLMRKLTISSIENPIESSTIKTKTMHDMHLNSASLHHLKKLAYELMSECDIDPNEGWEDIIHPLVLKASFKTNLNVKGGDNMDILRYVKIKRIPGGSPSDSEYIDGVVCSKNLTHKMMPRYLSRPRILILTFPFEYQRVDYQFMSIEPIIAQESEHLKNMVARVLALRPTLVIAERTISRVALDFLHKANLCVAMNVKRSVIRAIARCTQAEIISSLEQLWLEPRLGDCQTFEVQTFMHKMIPTGKKSYLFFKGCSEELGCTIILRGGNMEKLAKIKNIVRLLLNASYSLKLETVLLRDELAKIPSPELIEPILDLVKSDNLNQEIYTSTELDPLSLDIDKAILSYKNKTLSSSPFVHFPVPYLLNKMKEEVNKMRELNEKYKINMATKVAGSLNSLRPEEKYIPSIFSIDYTPNKGANASIDEHIQNFRSYHAFLNNFQPSLSPFSHQSITILYCNVSTYQTIICQPPQSYTIEYYKSSDLTLGQFLELSCFDLKVLCGTCDQSVVKHSRSYVHGNARVTVTVEELPSPIAGMESTILMWSYCKQCEKVLPIVPMAEETWKLSLGKYLELTFYHENLKVRAGLCPHDIHKDHIRYFGFNDLAARFEYEPIDLMEVNVPPTKLYFNHEISMKLKSQDYENLKKKIDAYWNSVSEKTKSLLMYSISAAKSETCRQDLMEMSRRVAAERSYTLQILQQTFLNSLPTDTLALNLVLRVMQEKIAEWDNEFALVIRRHLQTEKDLRRLTTHQLRRLFPEKEINNTDVTEREQLLKELTETENNKGAIKIQENNSDLESFLPLLGNSPSKTAQLCHFPNVLDDMPAELTYTPVMDGSIYRRNSLKLILEEKQQKEERQTCSPPPTHNPITPIPRTDKQIDDYISNEFKRLTPKITSTDDMGLETISRRLVEDGVINHKANKVSLGGTISKLSKPVNNIKYSTGTLTRNILTPRINAPSLNNSARNSPKPQIKISAVNPIVKLNDKRKKVDENIKSRYNLRSIERRSSEKKKGVENVDLQFHFGTNSKVKRANTTATSRPSRHRKGAIEIYLNTKEAVQDESDSEEETPKASSSKQILSSINNFDDPLSPNLEQNALANPRELGNEIEALNVLPELDVKPILGVLGHGDEPNPSPPVSPNIKSESIFNQQIPNDTTFSKSDNIDLPSGYDRGSIIQTLSTFLGGVSSINQVPLEYPIQPTEHIFPDSPIVLREDEPSSIIAFTLSTKDYFEQISYIRKTRDENNRKTSNHIVRNISELTLVDKTEEIPMDIEADLKCKTGHHMRYQLNEGALKLTCKIFYALQFEALRKYCDMEELFVESLARCVKWSASGGKSSAIFLKTRDNRLVMKEVSKAELDAFLKFAPLYFSHMAEALFEGLPVLLAKIFGIFRINIKNIHTGRSLKIDVLIMENLFYERKISKIFDLKGSFRNRHVQSTGKENEVLLDENLMEMICKSPIFIRAHSKQHMHMAIFNDTKFLSSLKVMDYSLLVGIDESNHSLVVGIVDFIRTFTWDKKLESWVKESGILGGGGEKPTIVSPSNYKHRFRNNIDGYFLMVPDKYYSKRVGQLIRNGRHQS